MEYMNLHIIATGGTFEKHYDEITGELVFTSSHIPAMMERRPGISIVYIPRVDDAGFAGHAGR